MGKRQHLPQKIGRNVLTLYKYVVYEDVKSC